MTPETEQSLRAKFFALDNEADELKKVARRNGWEKDRLMEIDQEKHRLSEQIRKLKCG